MSGNFAIKGGGGGGPLMANAILNFHFDFLTTSLTSWTKLNSDFCALMRSLLCEICQKLTKTSPESDLPWCWNSPCSPAPPLANEVLQKKGLKNMESTLFLASSTFPDSQVSQWVSRHESTLCSVGLQLPGEQDQGRLKVFLDGVQRVTVVKDMWFFAF